MNDTFMDKLTRVGMWGIVILAMFLWIGVLLAPLLLPHIRKIMEEKYFKYTYKDNLITEEMSIYTPTLWVLCCLGWIVTISYLLFVGL